MKKLLLLVSAVIGLLILAACTASSADRPTPTGTVTNMPPVIPHTLQGRAECDVCHASGISGIPIWPADHFGRRDDLCIECHKPQGEVRATLTPVLVAQEIPHNLVGRDDCLLCHLEGLASAPAVPSFHAGRSNRVCTLCHAPGVGAEPTPAIGPTATPRTAINPPAIPHSLDGRAQCFLCHNVDKLPVDHADRPTDLCTICHAPLPAPTPTSTPTPLPPGAPTPTPAPTKEPSGPVAIPHPLEGRGACLMCHTNPKSVASLPANHAGRAENTCTLCHQQGAAPAATPTAAPTAAPTTQPGPTATATPTPAGSTATPAPGATPTPTVAPPTPTPTPTTPVATPTAAPSGPAPIPHSVEGRTDCLMCHATGIAGAQAVPADHAGRANATCQLCHKPK